jgi:hypothetical protein
LGLIGLGVKLELLRLLAFVAGVDMRTLRNWHLRRTVVRVALVSVFTLLPLLALLNFPLDDWDPVTLKAKNQPLNAIAAEVSGDKLLVASRFRAASQERPRNYVRLTSMVPGTDGGDGDFSGKFPLRRRLLPRDVSAFAFRMPKLELKNFTSRKTIDPPFITEALPGKWVVVQPLAPTEEEIQTIKAAAQEADVPISVPRMASSLVITINGGEIRAAELKDLLPVWQSVRNMDPTSAGPLSPSKGLAVAWTQDGHIWLGAPGWDAQAEGGLWRGEANGQGWKRIDGFLSVSSIAIRENAGRLYSVVVAESHFDRWRGSFLEPYPTRVVEQRVGETAWRPASMPPYSSRSEVESCGTLGGVELVRVDEIVYSRRDLALWRFLLKRVGISP